MDITFSTFRIVVQNGIDNRTLTIDDFKQVEFPSNFTTENNGLVYDCSMSLIDNSYLWIYSKFGNPNPCPNQVFDKNKSQYQNNTRTPNLVEMRKQLFVLFDFDNNMLYLNISNKRKFVEEMLKTKLDLGITISSIYTDLNDFDKKIKDLSLIKFTSQDNLFTANSTLNNAFRDLLGYGANIDFTIEINCKNKPLEKGSIINNLKNRLTNQEVKNLILIGENENKFEQIFNSGTFSKKISFLVKENDEKLMEEIEVRQQLLEKIKNV